MGYRGKVAEQERARALRADGWALQDIADELGVAKSSASLWCRDVDPGPRPKRRVPRDRPPNVLQRRKQAEIERLAAEGVARIGSLSERDLLIAGTALYAGEGAKGGGEVALANTNAAIISLHCRWLRHFFDPDEVRLRVRVQLHEGLDLETASAFWAQVTAVPRGQFHSPARVPARGAPTKHPMGCASVRYGCSRTHRAVMGLVEGLLTSTSPCLPG